MSQAPKHVYVHIPFCSRKCFYCDFNVFVWQGDSWVEQYLDALEQEMKLRIEVNPPQMVDTIYIGGGTPTILTPKQLERLLAMLQTYFPNRSNQYEMTMEVNPGTLTAEKCEVLLRYGVNRLSIGVQSFNNQLLTKIGRQHTVEEALNCIQMARRQGFENISIDLIYGLPEQSMEDVKKDLEIVRSLHIEHLSAYNLRVEEQTIFYLWQQQQRLKLPPEDLEVDMYHYIIHTLEEMGIKQYEISNFARTGHESKHNLAYWLNREYYGIGAGAHGYIERVRYENVGPLRKYMKSVQAGLPIFEQHHVTDQERMEEMLFLGLRLNEGIRYQRFDQEWGEGSLQRIYHKEIADLVHLGLLEQDEIGIRLAPQGRLLSNEVFTRFLRDDYE